MYVFNQLLCYGPDATQYWFKKKKNFFSNGVKLVWIQRFPYLRWFTLLFIFRWSREQMDSCLSSEFLCKVKWKYSCLRFELKSPIPFLIQTIHFKCIGCLNFWEEAWWFLSLRVSGLLSSSLLLFLQCFGWYVLRASSGVCRTQEPSWNFEVVEVTMKTIVREPLMMKIKSIAQIKFSMI